MKRLAVALMLSASAAAGVAGTALAATGSQTPPASAAQPAQPIAAPPSNPMSDAGPMMGSGGMMGGGMTGMMMGGNMMGWGSGQYTSPMMGGGTNIMDVMKGMMRGGPGGMMGVALANTPGPRVPQSAEKTLASAVPAGATVDRVGNAIAFGTKQVRLTMVADSANVAGANRMFFEIAGLRNPTITVPAGATVTVQFVNADDDEAHLLAFLAASPPFPFMAMMMDAWPAFPGAEAPPLGDPTAAGLHSATFTFVASKPGRYAYLCLVPGHAQQGMFGHFVVTKAAT